MPTWQVGSQQQGLDLPHQRFLTPMQSTRWLVNFPAGKQASRNIGSKPSSLTIATRIGTDIRLRLSVSLSASCDPVYIHSRA